MVNFSGFPVQMWTWERGHHSALSWAQTSIYHTMTDHLCLPWCTKSGWLPMVELLWQQLYYASIKWWIGPECKEEITQSCELYFQLLCRIFILHYLFVIFQQLQELIYYWNEWDTSKNVGALTRNVWHSGAAQNHMHPDSYSRAATELLFWTN